MDDDRMISVLASLGEALDTPEVEIDTSTLQPRQRLRRPLIAVAVVLLAVVGVALSPAPAAVARWLGIGDTNVVIDDEANVAQGRLDDDARRAEGDDLAVVVGSPLLSDTPETLVPPEGGLLFVWGEPALSLWVRPLGAIETVKRPTSDAAVEWVEDVGDDRALWIGADHPLVTAVREVGAERVLLWTAGGYELRLESGLTKEEAVRIARSIEVTVGTGDD
jgi:hypothetical protein